MDQEMKRKRMEAIEAQTKYNIEKRMRKLEQKKTKAKRISGATAGLILLATLSSCAPKKEHISQVGTHQEVNIISQIDNAQDEVIIDYINASELQCEEYLLGASEEMANSQIKTLYDSYYVPAIQAYENYKYTKEIDRKDYLRAEFIKEAKEYNNEVYEINKSFAFDNSIYSRARYIDGQVCIPYTGNIQEINDYEYFIDPDNRNVVYISLSQLKENEKSMK